MRVHAGSIGAAAAFATFLTACAGHTAGTLPPRAQQSASVQFTIKVPQAAGLRAQYISPATQSVAINSQAFNVTPSSPGCSTQSGALICTFTVDAPNLGQAVFTVVTYDRSLTSSGAVQGNPLSSGSTTVNIVAGTANAVKVTTSGVPASATFSIANLTPPMGTATKIPVTFNVKDADGYTIAGGYTTSFQLQPLSSGGNPVMFLVNGTDACCAYIWSSNDSVAIDYPGHGVSPTTIAAVLNNTTIGSVLFDPQPAFGSETTVNTPLNNAEAFRDTGAPVTTYFTEPAKNSLGTMQGGTNVMEFRTPSGGTPLHLTHTFIPEGVMFTESNGEIGSIGIVNGQIAISDRAVSNATPNAGFYQLAQFGLSGTQAVTEYNAGKVGEFVNEGDPLAGGAGIVFVEYATGVANSTPAGIIPLFNGFEFADPGANAIGFLSSSNTFTFYPVPSPGAHPTAIVTDQNGNAWFTEPGVSKIGKIDSNNHITEYACGGSPLALVGQYQYLGVLTSAGNIDIYKTADGSYKEYVPPSSPAGPVVGIGDGGEGDIIVLRSNGTTGAIEDFYYL